MIVSVWLLIEQQTINAMCVNKGCQLKLIQSLWRQRISGSHYDRIYRSVKIEKKLDLFVCRPLCFE